MTSQNRQVYNCETPKRKNGLKFWNGGSNIDNTVTFYILYRHTIRTTHHIHVQLYETYMNVAVVLL